MISTPMDGLRDAFGFGVAGNFAGHLEQAGEATDFVNVAAATGAPKGIFPWYAPGDDTFLGTFPLATDRVELPAGDDLNLQIEPEVAVLVAVDYDDAGDVGGLRPVAIGAFNDCSIRRAGATKISQKKNWGPASKGVAAEMFPIEDLSPDGPTAGHRLASFLRRDGRCHAYGIDSPLPGYSYYGTTLLDWITDRLRNQSGAPDTPLEDVGGMLDRCGRPALALVGIGATRYTEVGESTYLRPGDESIVIVYDSEAASPEWVAEAVAAGREDDLSGASVLRQRVVGSAAG